MGDSAHFLPIFQFLHSLSNFWIHNLDLPSISVWKFTFYLCLLKSAAMTIIETVENLLKCDKLLLMRVTWRIPMIFHSTIIDTWPKKKCSGFNLLTVRKWRCKQYPNMWLCCSQWWEGECTKQPMGTESFFHSFYYSIQSCHCWQ